MTLAERLAASEGFAGEADRRKRLGQFFTGTGLGKVLAALSFADQASSIVDPMAGSGDLLAACLEFGAQPESLGSVEIDPMANAVCRKRLQEASCVLGSAFDSAVLAGLPCRQWDLVITNPPYVRYQNMAQGAGKDFRLPRAIDVRNGLMEVLDHMPALDTTDRALFRIMVSGYSGLADLAVPSWILCAAMVSLGGRIALVVPESWLSRDYAAVIHYLLLRWFRIEHIVEDENAAWFEDAQVKTTLLIARRVERRDSAFDWDENDIFTRTVVSGQAVGPEGPISCLFPGKKNKEELFAAKAKKVLKSGVGFDEDLFSVSPVPLKRVAENLKATCFNQKWFSTVGENMTVSSGDYFLPDSLAAWLGDGKGSSLVSLKALGVSVGQGLRTGANGFFYVTHLSDDGQEALVSPNSVVGVDVARIPLVCLRPAVRRQSDLSEGYTVREVDLVGRVIDLRAHALPEDIRSGGKNAEKIYAPMSEELAAFVRKAALADFGTSGMPKRIQELTAVAPNIRKGNVAKGIPPRFWYMLPDFAPRHSPELLVPRINASTPKVWVVGEKGTIVDANFSALNIVEGNYVDTYALLALLNSTWCQAVLEHSAAVMGGGALKIEATHLRRMPVPKLSPDQWSHLSVLGRRLAEAGHGLDDINKFVVSAILGRSENYKELMTLSRLVDEARIRRENHKKKN